MGAGVSAARRAIPPSFLPPNAQSNAAVHPTASGVAVLGQPPAPGRPVGPLFGAVRSKTTRKHLETQIEALTADLCAAKKQCAAAERDLQDERLEREQMGVPRTECVVCMAACVSTVLLPCGHLCLCVNCATAFQQLQKRPESKGVSCPLCRLPVQNLHRVYLPVEEPPPKPPPGKAATPGSPTSSDSSGESANESIGVQVSPSLRSAASLHPRPRVYKRSPPHPRRDVSVAAGTRLVVHSALANEYDDIERRPAHSIIRPPSSPLPATPPSRAERGVIEVRGSPAERPGNYDFVLPGAYVPSSPNPAFARTWDGALRVRD